MSCAYPIVVKVNGVSQRVPCGRCMCCMVSRRMVLSKLANYELQQCYKRGLGSSFLTLTYNPDSVPFASGTPYTTLEKSALQKFLKRFRRNSEYYGFSEKFKYLACGEYGSNGTCRPHYHIVMLGVTDVLAKTFSEKCWKNGFVQVGSLRSGGVDYITKYLTKSHIDKEIEKFYDFSGVQKPFFVRSQNIGSQWLAHHASEIVKNGYCVRVGNDMVLLPREMREKVCALTGVNPRPYIEQYIERQPYVNDRELERYLLAEQKEKLLIARNRQNGVACNSYQPDRAVSYLLSTES